MGEVRVPGSLRTAPICPSRCTRGERRESTRPGKRMRATISYPPSQGSKLLKSKSNARPQLTSAAPPPPHTGTTDKAP